jgi:hypothetical protein
MQPARHDLRRITAAAAAALLVLGAAAAAGEFLKPDQIRVLIAGDPEKLKEGAARDKIALDDFGPLAELPIRDPME